MALVFRVVKIYVFNYFSWVYFIVMLKNPFNVRLHFFEGILLKWLLKCPENVCLNVVLECFLGDVLLKFLESCLSVFKLFNCPSKCPLHLNVLFAMSFLHFCLNVLLKMSFSICCSTWLNVLQMSFHIFLHILLSSS